MSIIAKNLRGGGYYSEELIRRRQGYRRRKSFGGQDGEQGVNNEKCKKHSSLFDLHSSLSFLLASAISLVTGGAWAATLYWKGGNGLENEPVNINAIVPWTTSDTYSGKSITQLPAEKGHNLHFGFAGGVEDTTTWLKSENTSVDTVIAANIYTHNGRYIFNDSSFKYAELSVGYKCDSSTLIKNGGEWKGTAPLYIGNEANGVVKINGGSLEAGKSYIAYSANTTGGLEIDSGSVKINDDFYVGYSGNGTLTINGGLVEVLSSKTTYPGYFTGSSGTINLNGGILKTQRIAHFKESSTINFNGGTLQANASNADFIKSGMVVQVGAGGGVIDCGGNAVKINTSLTGTGGMLFAGGNKIVIADECKVGYSGVTSVATGTTFVVSRNVDKNNVLDKGLLVVGAPNKGDEIFIVRRGPEYTISDEQLAKVICPIAPDTVFECGEGNTNIVVKSVGSLLSGWYIGPKDGNLSDPANWSDGVVPTSGNATISCTSTSALTVGETFAPSAITFAAGSAPVAINGRDLTGIAAVTNLSFVSHTINSKVTFAGNIQVSQPAMGGVDDLNKPHVTFAGGAYAAEGCSLEGSNTDPVYSRCVFGEYFLANTEAKPWTVKGSTGGNGHRRNCLAPNSILHVSHAGDIGTIYVGSNAKLLVGNHTAINPRLVYANLGEVIIDNLTLSGAADINAMYSQDASSRPVFKFASVVNSLSGITRFRMQNESGDGKHVFYIGKGGLNFSGTTGQYIIGRDVANSNFETIRPWNDDFTIAGHGSNIGIYLLGNIEFCTDNENNEGRTITLDAKTVVRPNTSLTVSGKGTLKVNNTYIQDNSGELKTITLKDTATLEYATATASLGTGSITLGAGTTFVYTNVGKTLNLPSQIILPTDGAAILRINGQLSHGAYILAESVDEDAANRLIVDASSPALERYRFNVEVKNGNLVLNVISTALKVIIR